MQIWKKVDEKLTDHGELLKVKENEVWVVMVEYGNVSNGGEYEEKVRRQRG